MNPRACVSTPPAQRLRELFYVAKDEQGRVRLFNRYTRNSRSVKDTPAGAIDEQVNSPRFLLSVDGRLYKQSRLMLAYYGVPIAQHEVVRHIDGDTLNDNPWNLRVWEEKGGRSFRAHYPKEAIPSHLTPDQFQPILGGQV